MQLKINRLGQNIEAHIELSLSERRAARELGISTVYGDKLLQELEMGIQIPASEENSLRSACVNLKRQIDAHPSMGSMEVVNFDQGHQHGTHECACEELFLGARVIDILKVVAAGTIVLFVVLAYTIGKMG